jgi:hypothetical protein
MKFQMTDTSTELAELKERVQALQRALYFLVWKRTGFGDQCLHCGKQYPKHENHCRAAEIEQLIR